MMHGFFWQGFLVIWSNPKALFVFGACIPQFVEQALPVAPQVVLLGSIFMVVASVLDSAYAVLARRTGALFVGNRLRVLKRVFGTCLIGGGLWMLTPRSP